LLLLFVGVVSLCVKLCELLNRNLMHFIIKVVKQLLCVRDMALMIVTRMMMICIASCIVCRYSVHVVCT